MLSALDVPRRIFPEIVPSGTRLGPMRTELAYEVGLPKLEVIATCSHDTGAAVAAVPAGGDSWAYLSSGTWSLMGVELPEPVITEAARELNFTNEIGFGNSVRFLKNISGLWLIQECRRQWSREGREFDYATLTRLAGAAPAFGSLINPMAVEFLAPANMPGQIADFCRKNYGVTFPMFAKLSTRPGAAQSPIYAFLGAGGQLPAWNFSKYVVGKDGKVVAFFPSAVTPDSAELRAAINKALNVVQ